MKISEELMKKHKYILKKPLKDFKKKDYELLDDFFKDLYSTKGEKEDEE